MGVGTLMRDAATTGGRGAANMWSTFRQGYISQGLTPPRATLADMNTYVVGLGGIMRSIAAFAGSQDSTALDSAHITTPIGYVPSQADQAAPSLLVTFQAMISGAAGLETRWSSIAYNTLIPSTVGEIRQAAMTRLQAQLDEAQMQEGADYPDGGVTVIGIGQMYAQGKGF